MYVFVCYAGPEDAAAWELTNALDSSGHEAWMDRWLFSEPDWREQINAVLRRTKLMLYVLDKATLADKQRTWVVSRAVEANIPTVVVRLDPNLHLPEWLRNCPTVDFTQGTSLHSIGDLIATVQQESRKRGTVGDDLPDPRHRSIVVEYRAYMIMGLTAFTIALSLLLGRALGPNVYEGIPLTDLPALTRLFMAVYQVGPIGVFLATALLFTGVRGQALSLFTLLFVQIVLVVGYLVAPGGDFVLFLVMLGISVVGFFVGETHILLWPWISFRLEQVSRQYAVCLDTGEFPTVCAANIIHLLDYPIMLPPTGAAAAMQMLADEGLTVVQFAAHSVNPAVQEEYQHFVHQISMEKLEGVTGFSDALAIIQAYQIIPYEARTQIKVFLEKREHTTNTIEIIRAYGQFLWYLEKPENGQLAEPGQGTSTGALQATQLLVRLAYRSIRFRDAVDYWLLYRWLEANVERVQSLSQGGANTVINTPRVLIRDAVLRLTETVDILRQFDNEMLLRFPAREYKWHIELITSNLDTGKLLTNEYQERQNALTREIERLKQLHRSQPASWLTINKNATEVVEHFNPWCLLTLQLIELLETIKKLDVEYVNWAELQITGMLTEIKSLQDVAELEQQLAGLEISGDSFGPMVDGTVRWLTEISTEAQSAVDWPQGTYQYRQSLINAQQKLDDLRIWLHSRFNRARPRQWADMVRAMGRVMETHLEEQRTVDTSTYVDPYIVGNPIPAKRAALFKGRMELAERIVEWLRSDNRPTLVLHGARRMGKTSFLLQLQNLMSGWHDSPIAIFVDGQMPGLVQSDASFFYNLTRKIHTQLKRRGLQITRPPREDFNAYPYETLTPWLEDEVLPLIGEDARLLVTIDEFEKIGNAIRNGKLSERVLDFLRHTVQHNENILFLFCGVETVDSLGPNAASYFIGVQAIEISFLDSKAGEELIRNPNEEDRGLLPHYSASAVREILALTHGQPYLIQAICSRIINRASERQLKNINTTTLRDILPDVMTSGRTYFLNIWEDAGKEGQRILLALAEGPRALTPKQAISPAVRALVERHVICRVGEPDALEYQIEIPLVQQWVARRLVPQNPQKRPVGKS